ncbi:MAG TPA: hypothetical protein DFH97_00745 [Clostridiales bacterium]|nr:hypothetical protein [Clostridiales bacterium]
MPDYQFYIQDYLGSAISEEDFPRLCKRAGEVLARYKRIYTVTEPESGAEKMAVCAMTDALSGFEAIQNGEAGAIQSAAIGSVSVNYGTSTAVDISPKGQARELYRCASLYLDIYRG